MRQFIFSNRMTHLSKTVIGYCTSWLYGHFNAVMNGQKGGGQNSDEKKKTAVWARMVKDDGYVTQPNSGAALTFLGDAMEKLGEFNKAAEYQSRTAVAFLKTNPSAAAAACIWCGI